MTFFDRTTRVEMAGNALTEYPDGVPTHVADFAMALVDARCLGEGLELQCAITDGRCCEFGADLIRLESLDGFAAFRRWLAFWAAEYAHYAGAALIRLDLVHGRAPTCPRFHVDNVRLRLISTLIGPGTEWLYPEDVQYDSNERIQQAVSPGAIQRMQTGSVGLFPGSLGGASPCRGVVHRSPLTDVDRVVLKMDTIA